MIGLGSNRLTVCRRGGMSVTQAGRGGMEWLAGVRWPRWATPYSAQATAALKAQFSLEQWPTIRDYGFAHPALVPFINEDPMMVCSLMELGKIRWLVGDGASWVNSLYKPMTKNTKLKTLLKVSSTTTGGTDGVFGCRVSSSSSRYNIFMNGDSQVVRPDWAKPDSDYTQYSITRDTPYEMEIKAGYFKLNNNVIYNQSYDKPSYDAYFYIFANNNNGTAAISKGASFAFAELLEGSEQVRNLIPFIGQNRDGMIDLVNMEFHPNQGTGHFIDAFTEQDGVTPWSPS